MHLPTTTLLLLSGITTTFALPKLVTVTEIITRTATAGSSVATPPSNISPVVGDGKAIAPGTSTGTTSFTDATIFQNDILAAHNFYRQQHNASDLTWNTTSATFASKYVDGCSFKHSGGPTGENLVASLTNATYSVDLWGQERKDYNFKSGGFSEDTGHFSQLVWKATTSVGCGVKNCKGKLNYYVVCEYYPQGNVGVSGGGDVNALYKVNVQKQVEGEPGDTAVENVAKQGTSSVTGTGSGSGTSTGSATPAATSKKSAAADTSR
jgi:uncharacterized protein YkwD